MPKLKVRMVKSMIGRPEKQRNVLRGLGLFRINQEVEREDTPAVRGMIKAIQHLVTGEEKTDEA
ncbi:MAG: 50S ribosomal protein L30 [Pseudomonadota bacterium]